MTALSLMNHTNNNNSINVFLSVKNALQDLNHPCLDLLCEFGHQFIQTKVL